MTEGQPWDRVRCCEIIIATDGMCYYDDNTILIISFSVLCFLETYQLAVGQIIGLIFIVLLFFLVSFPYSLSFCSTFWEDLCVSIYPSGLHWWFSGKESTCQCRRCRFDPWVEKIPWRRKCQPTPVFLPGKSHGQRSLLGYSPWGHKRIRHDLTKQQQISIYMLSVCIHICNWSKLAWMYAYR